MTFNPPFLQLNTSHLASYERRLYASGICFVTQDEIFLLELQIFFLKALLKCYHVQIAVVYLSILPKSSQV